MSFGEYVALGDSYSGNLYPALAAGATSVAVALERVPQAGDLAPIGAAALLYENDDERWPDFAGRDLRTRYPGIGFRSLVEDGATIGDVFGEQLSSLDESSAPTLITLTVGAGDVMSLLSRRPAPAVVRHAARDIAEAYEFLLDAVRRLRPDATILAATVCDPSDGSGHMPGVDRPEKPVPLEALDAVNASIRALAQGTPGVLLADLHAHFLGHGVGAAAADRWYWPRAPLDLNATGASEVRRVWLDALERIGA